LPLALSHAILTLVILYAFDDADYRPGETVASA